MQLVLREGVLHCSAVWELTSFWFQSVSSLFRLVRKLSTSNLNGFWSIYISWYQFSSMYINVHRVKRLILVTVAMRCAATWPWRTSLQLESWLSEPWSCTTTRSRDELYGKSDENLIWGWSMMIFMIRWYLWWFIPNMTKLYMDIVWYIVWYCCYTHYE